MVKEIGPDTYILEDNNALVSIIDRRVEAFSHREDTGSVLNVTSSKETFEIQSWGKNNLLPDEREYLVAENNIVGELISTKRGIILGSKLIAYKTHYEDGMEVKEQVELPTEIEDWMGETDINGYLRKACKNALFHSNIFTEMIAQRGDKKKIAKIAAKECRHIRAARMRADGKIHDYYWSGGWGKYKRGSRDWGRTVKIPAYNPENPVPKSILHTGDDLLTLDDYYYHPVWWGGKQWILLANCIPEFHLANLKHGYNIRYHIRIPKDYFSDKTASASTEKDRMDQITREAEAKRNFMDQMNDFLAGIKNSGRAVFSTFETNLQYVVGTKYPGIEIEPITADLQDEAMLKLFERSNQANISSQGIHPTLAAIETQGKLSSGTEIRNAFLMYVAIKTPTIRRILLEPLRMVQKANGWDPKLQFWFKDIELAKLDDSPTGKTEAINE